MATVWVYPAEILPLKIRSKGAALAAAADFLGNFLVGYHISMEIISRAFILTSCSCYRLSRSRHLPLKISAIRHISYSLSSTLLQLSLFIVSIQKHLISILNLWTCCSCRMKKRIKRLNRNKSSTKKPFSGRLFQGLGLLLMRPKQGRKQVLLRHWVISSQLNPTPSFVNQLMLNTRNSMVHKDMHINANEGSQKESDPIDWEPFSLDHASYQSKL